MTPNTETTEMVGLQDSERSIVERMAREMAANDSGPEGSPLFDIHWRKFGPGYMDNAIAALKAQRETSLDMLMAALNEERRS